MIYIIETTYVKNVFLRMYCIVRALTRDIMLQGMPRKNIAFKQMALVSPFDICLLP